MSSEPVCQLQCRHAHPSSLLPPDLVHCLGSHLLKPPQCPFGGILGCSQSFQFLMGRALLGLVGGPEKDPFPALCSLSLGSCEQGHEPLAIIPYPKYHQDSQRYGPISFGPLLPQPSPIPGTDEKQMLPIPSTLCYLPLQTLLQTSRSSLHPQSQNKGSQ